MFLLKPFLWLVSLLYGGVIGLRNLLYDFKVLPSYKVSLPVICVGNAVAGGSGKTPLVINIANKLIANGKRIAILSRGYGGSIKGPYRLNSGELSSEVGDEPLLIKELYDIEVIIARDRLAGAQYIEKEGMADVIIMDDGYQHRRLKRDLNILCFNIATKQSVKSFLGGRLLPFGRLRESLSAALKRADILVFNRRQSVENFLDLPELKFFDKNSLPSHTTSLRLDRLLALDNRSCLCAPADVILVSGIANPEGFQKTLTLNEFKTVKTYFYPDHYQYTEEDLKEIRSTHPNLAIICTEKDAIKINRLDIDLSNIYSAQVSLQYQAESPDWVSLLSLS